MKEPTKNIITREFIEKELRFYNTADIKAGLLLGSVLSALLIPAVIAVLFGFSPWVYRETGKIVFSIIFTAFLLLFFLSPLFFFAQTLFSVFAERKKLLKGEFVITIRKLENKKEKIVQRHIEECLCFKNYGDCSVGSTVYQLADKGDKFYIVHYKADKTVKLLYPAEMYEYVIK